MSKKKEHSESEFYYPDEFQFQDKSDLTETNYARAGQRENEGNSQEEIKTIVKERKINGDQYEPDTLSGFQRRIQRFLSDAKFPFDILVHKKFEMSFKVLAAKQNEEDKLLKSGQFGVSSPEALQRAMWWSLNEWYRNFRPFTRTADYPHRLIFAKRRKKNQQIARTGG